MWPSADRFEARILRMFRSSSTIRIRLKGVSALLRLHRKTDSEPDKVRLVAGECEVALMPQDNAPGDCQPQTGAGWFSREKRLENLSCYLTRNRAVIVFDVDENTCSFQTSAYFDSAPC